jgi:hypothetical protein
MGHRRVRVSFFEGGSAVAARAQYREQQKCPAGFF